MSQKIVCGDRVLESTTVSLARLGGGNYRRAGRRYYGATCSSCIEHDLCYVSVSRDGVLKTVGLQSRYEVSELLAAVADLIEDGESDLDEARWRGMFIYAESDWHRFEEFWPAFLDALERWAPARIPRYARTQELIDAARTKLRSTA